MTHKGTVTQWGRSFVTILISVAAIGGCRLHAQAETGWRIAPDKLNVQVGDDRVLQVLDDSAQELRGADWSLDMSTLAEIREEDGRPVVHAKAAGTVTVSATIRGERCFRKITIWPQDQPIPQGTVTWGGVAIGREVGDISAVPTPGGPNTFALEQIASGKTYLRAVREDGIQIWTWLMPEETHDVDLVCGDWMGGALISANRNDSYTIYTVGSDGKLRWQQTLTGVRKAHAYNHEHVIHILSQSRDGLAATVSGINQETGAKLFDLPIPTSRERLTNVRRSGAQMVCAPGSSTSPVRMVTSGLFVNIDDYAYVAFTEQDSTLTARGCTAGEATAGREVSAERDDRVVLWQIHPDGTYRSTLVEEQKATRDLSAPATIQSPTGGIIPDDSGGVLLSMRKSAWSPGSDRERSIDEYVYRVNSNGDLLYRFTLPKYEGARHDGMLLGQANVLAFATRGGTLVVFNVQDGKEAWRWESPQEIEAYVALANGGCLVQTPTAVMEVLNATTARKVLDGRVMIDWQGKVYRKSN